MLAPAPHSEHRDVTLDKFTRTADAYASAPSLAAEDVLRHLVRLAVAGADDTVLDVACGPGFVACAFAPVVARATGIDLTPAMFGRAEALGRQKGLADVSWKVGDVLPLPFPDASFSISVSRYALHHMQDPRAVVAEMARIAKPGGKVLVVDVHVSPEPEKAELYNRMERLRDPSHVRAMPLDELEGLVPAAGLRRVDTAFYGVEFEVESLILGSLPAPGRAEEVRRLLAEEVETGRMGLRAWRQGTEVRFAYPIAAILATKDS